MSIETINPATGQTIRRYERMDAAAIEQALDAADRAQQDWRRSDFGERTKRLRRAAGLLRERADEYAVLMAEEMGKPLAQGKSEAEKCAWVCEYYAEHGAGHLAPRPVETDAEKSFVAFEPLGVILAIMPWNFPYWQVFRFAAPTLMAGNAGLLKHAANVTGCALAIEKIFKDAGFPEGLFRTLVIDQDQTADVIRDRRVRAVSLTGSVGAGRKVAALAGEQLKKCVLELGGSDAYVVLEDADVAQAAEVCVAGRLVNSGQSCIAAKRWIVVDAVREAFTEKVTQLLRDKKLGNPTAEGTDIGPMARIDLRDELHEQVENSVAAGARLVMGGVKPKERGAWYPVTLLTEVRKGMPAYDEELFGPVACILPAKDEAEAVRIANDSDFGLGGAVFTGDRARGERLATHEIHSGAVFVNQQLKSDPRLPFGGIKDSGYGRELGAWGILEFVNIKSVSVA